MPVWLPTSYSGNNGTGHFSYQLETGEPLENFTAGQPTNFRMEKKILMIRAHFMAQCF